MQVRGVPVLVVLLAGAAALTASAAEDELAPWTELRRALPDVSWRRLRHLQRLVDRHKDTFRLEDFLRETHSQIEFADLPPWLSLPEDGKSSQLDPGQVLNLLVSVTVGPYITPIGAGISPRCLNDSWAFASNILSNNIWALTMFDADGKLPDGVTAGNLNAIGSWYECRKVTATANSIADGLIPLRPSHFKGKHCRVQFAMPSSPPNVHSHAEGPFSIGLRHIDGLGLEPFLPALMNFTGGFSSMGISASIGLCIPSSCSAEDLRMGLQQRMPNLTISLEESDCSVKDEKVTFSAGDIVMITILVITGFFMLIGTFIDVIKDQSKQDDASLTISLDKGFRGKMPLTLQKVFFAFSVWSNGKKILDTSSSSETLGCLHGIRFLSMTWVILGHQYMFGLMSVPWANEIYAFDALKSLAFSVVVNGTVSVDSFFFLSGLLVAYVFMRNMEKSKGRFNIIMYYVHRYIRLTPVLAMVIGFVSTLYGHLGDGPFWGKNVVYGGSHFECSKYWWKNLIYINNLYESDHNCLGQTWYLANDMQMFIASPIVLLPLYFWPTLGQLWLMLLIALNVFVRGYITSYNDLGPTGGQPSLRYFVPWSRYGVYLVGIYTGWFLHVRRGRRLKLSLPVVLGAWTLAAASACLIVYGLYDYQGIPPETSPSRSVSIIYAAFSRPVWGLCLAWLVIACVHGYGGFINTLLSWKAWYPLSRLTYCMYLVSIDAQIWFYASLKSVLYFDQTVAVYQYLATLFVSFPVALIFSLAFESPMIMLEKIIFANVGVSKPKETAAKEAINGTGEPNGTTAISPKSD